jgi:hypothetical protein
MTLQVCIINENEVVRRPRAPRYTADDIDQTPVLHERHEPAEEFGVRDREVGSIVAPCWGARKGEVPCLRSRVAVRERVDY